MNATPQGTCGFNRLHAVCSVDPQKLGTLFAVNTLPSEGRRAEMATAKKQTTRGRKQDRARVAGGQEYEARYEGNKMGKSAAAVKKAVKKVGSSRNRVERSIGRSKGSASSA
jgi:hypothetical protein